MPKKLSQSPAAVLKSLLDEYQLSAAKLGAEIKLSQSAVYQISIGKTRVTASVAVRLAKYFGKTPEYWLNLQNTADLAGAANDKALTAIVKAIPKAKKPALVKKSAKVPATKKTPAKKTAKADAPKKGAKLSAPKKTAKTTTPKKAGRPRGKKAVTPIVQAETPFKPDTILIKKPQTT
jgi:addiction module HigA family antidote